MPKLTVTLLLTVEAEWAIPKAPIPYPIVSATLIAPILEVFGV